VLSQPSNLLARRKDIFSYGVTQSTTGTAVFRPGEVNGILTPCSYLQQHAPPPCDKEIGGGMGQVIHDKFVVVDFDRANPMVFTGSSNLAAGGEESNGDNLLAVIDKNVAEIFATQAVGLIDHFHFRAAKQTATDDKPLALDHSGVWWKDYFTQGTSKFRDRTLFCQ